MINGEHPVEVPYKIFKNVLSKPSKPAFYKGLDYGIPSKFTGKDVKIAILDTGCPAHADISNIVDHVSFADDARGSIDEHGHATMLTGLICANNQATIKGFAPDCNIFIAKVANEHGVGNFNALVAATLWSVVKKVDIILISMGTSLDYPLFHDAIIKAYDTNICIIAADSNSNGSTCYPADYKEVLAFKASPNRKKRKSDQHKVIIPMPTNGILTTFCQAQYMKVYGSSFAAALGAGLAALIIDRLKRTKKKVLPEIVFKELLALSY